MNVLIIGSGNAALCAGISALENGASVTILEVADKNEAGGNSKYTAGAMRFVYNRNEEVLPLLFNPLDERISKTEFGSYSKTKFEGDLIEFNDEDVLSLHQRILIDNSYNTLCWLRGHNIKFEPIYSRQSYLKNGKYIFWGGLTLAAMGEGVGLVEAELAEFLSLGGKIKYLTEALDLIVNEEDQVIGVRSKSAKEDLKYYADSVILACGGFEANPKMRSKLMGQKWLKSKVRGTKFNLGRGIQMAMNIGADFHGRADACHATPMDLHMPDYGNYAIPHQERKNYRKICYFLGIMLNANGERFVDEGKNFRNYTYAQFGEAILDQPGSFAWQVFDNKAFDLLYDEYKFWDASFVEAYSLEELASKMDGVDPTAAMHTIHAYNEAVDHEMPFDPTILDEKSTHGLSLNKTNWANALDAPPFRAYPVTCGITFTYGGLKVDEYAAVINKSGDPIKGLFACGELIGGIFQNGYPGGSGLTSGAVFGKIAGKSAVDKYRKNKK